MASIFFCNDDKRESIHLSFISKIDVGGDFIGHTQPQAK